MSFIKKYVMTILLQILIIILLLPLFDTFFAEREVIYDINRCDTAPTLTKKEIIHILENKNIDDSILHFFENYYSKIVVNSL